MKFTTSALICACMALAAGSVAAQDMMKKNDAMHTQMKPTMQQCKDHIAKAAQEGMTSHDKKPGDPAMKMDKDCADMMNDRTPMRNGVPADRMKK